MMQQRKNERQTSPLSEEEAYERLPFTFVSHSIASDKHVERNEDSLIADQLRGLAAVFDGVGGSVAGDVASQLATQVIQRGWQHTLQQLQQEPNAPPTLLTHSDMTYICAKLLHIVEEAHTQICSSGTQQSALEGRGRSAAESQATTVALAAFCQQPGVKGYTMIYLSVGDSRLYLLRDPTPLTCLTRDDGFLTKLVENKVISEADAWRIDQATQPEQLSETERAYFSKRNSITQALGDTRHPTIHIDQAAIFPGDCMLLCTDGIHDNLTSAEITDIMQREAPTTTARAIVEHAVQRSRQKSSPRAKSDDMTAIVVTCHY